MPWKRAPNCATGPDSTVREDLSLYRQYNTEDAGNRAATGTERNEMAAEQLSWKRSLPVAARHGRRLVALHVHYLLQSVLNLHQLPAVLHHFIDVFVGSRYFIDKTGAQARGNALHSLLQVLHGENLARFVPRHPSSRAVRRRMVGIRVSEA